MHTWTLTCAWNDETIANRIIYNYNNALQGVFKIYMRFVTIVYYDII